MNNKRRVLSIVAAALALGVAFAAPARKARVVEMAVTSDGFVPAEVKVKKGEPLELHVTRTVERTCAKDITIKDTSVRASLPLGEKVVVQFTPKKTGSLRYGCAMDQMVGGVLLVE